MDNNNQPSTSGYSEEAGRGYRLKRKQVDPIVCPVCSVSLRTTEVEMHLNIEIEKLGRIPMPKLRSSGRSTPSSSSHNGTSPKSPIPSHKDKKWEIYQKVRCNRQLRQKAKLRKKKNEDVCPICNKDVSTISEDLVMHVDNCLQRSAPLNESEDIETIDVEAYEEYEWAGQSRIRATSLLPDGVSSLGSSLSMADDDDENLNVDIDDSQMYGSAQFSERDIILPCNDEDNMALRKAVIGVELKAVDSEPLQEQTGTPDESASVCGSNRGLDPIVQVLKSRIRELENREQTREDNYKCLICMDRYHTPVISICCWHVHCEHCWLQTLGAKKLCPQCNMITSPSDLRRIYM